MIHVLIALAAFGALGIAVVAFLRERSLRESLQDARRRLYLAQARLNELESAVQKELQSLRAVVRRQAGSSTFDPTMRIADAIAIDPHVRDVLAQFHLGGCSSCGINEEHTIAQAALSYGVDIGKLMAALDSLNDTQPLVQSKPSQGGLLQLSEF
jgi:hybrid cluster-associated redox disulfide protein